jgi:hypothetical protein
MTRARAHGTLLKVSLFCARHDSRAPARNVSKVALAPSRREWFNRQRQLKLKTRKHTTSNLRLRLLSATKQTFPGLNSKR